MKQHNSMNFQELWSLKFSCNQENSEVERVSSASLSTQTSQSVENVFISKENRKLKSQNRDSNEKIEVSIDVYLKGMMYTYYVYTPTRVFAKSEFNIIWRVEIM